MTNESRAKKLLCSVRWTGPDHQTAVEKVAREIANAEFRGFKAAAMVLLDGVQSFELERNRKHAATTAPGPAPLA